MYSVLLTSAVVCVILMSITCCCSVPLVRPLNLIVDTESIRPTSVRLFWDKVDTSPDQIRGFFRGYRVSELLLLVHWTLVITRFNIMRILGYNTVEVMDSNF